MGEFENSALKAEDKLKSVRQNSRENNKAIAIKFIIIVAASILVGLLMGLLFSTNAPEAAGDFLSKIALFLKFNTSYIALGTNIVACIIAFSMFVKAKALYNKWDGEDEDLIDEVEEKLSYPLTLASIMMVVNFLFFGITLCSKPAGDEYNQKAALAVILGIVVILLSTVWEMIIQGKVIGLLKEINPEKRGNILDMRFEKKWLDSSDEAQKIAAYRASYDAFRVSKYVFIAAWLLVVLTEEILQTGIFPVVLVSVMWLIQTVVYAVSAFKYERKSTAL